MNKTFNTTGDCKPALHYIVDLQERLVEIKKLVDNGSYFTINRARQYGKTTMLRALAQYLQQEYIVISMDFQRFSSASFASENKFVITFLKTLLNNYTLFTSEHITALETLLNKNNTDLFELFDCLGNWCKTETKPIVLIIDEVDSASNNQIFLDFLAQLRSYYLNRDIVTTFHSVILAGVYDIKNLKMKLHPEWGLRTNSPWNIATDFNVTMSFSAKDIAGMLNEYAKDSMLNFDIAEISSLIYEYTSGYPFLVSHICKTIDERVLESDLFPTLQDAWTKAGFLQAVNILLNEKNTLFESLIHKINNYEEIYKLIYLLLFKGQSILYTMTNEAIDVAEVLGIIKNQNGKVIIANRIFETVLYNHILSKELLGNKIYEVATTERNQFIQNGILNMELVLEKFVQYFHDIYGARANEFIEEEGRKYFLLYLKPIINGVGNYYIESRTRDLKRTDVIIDYAGMQYIIEMKIWHGEEYNKRGEKQLCEYLDFYHLKKGYLLSFNFNKNKEVGMKHIECNGKMLVEAVV